MGKDRGKFWVGCGFVGILMVGWDWMGVSGDIL